MKRLFNTIYSRLVARTPVFFVNVQRFLLASSVTATTAIAMHSSYGFLNETMLALCKYSLVAGLFGTFLSQLTKKDDTNSR